MHRKADNSRNLELFVEKLVSAGISADALANLHNIDTKTEKQILKVLEGKEFRAQFPILSMELFKSLPHSYSIAYEFDSLAEAKRILDLEGLSAKRT